MDEEVEITKLSEYFEFVDNLDFDFTISRGQSNRNYRLLPGGFRKDSNNNCFYTKRQIKFFLDEFKNRSVKYIKESTENFNEIEWMAYAQHFGVPTKLLDFSKSHVVSLLFAVEKAFNSEQEEIDGIVYFLNPVKLNEEYAKESKIINISSKDFSFNPDNYDGPIVIESKRLNNRLKAQKGLFVYHNDENNPICEINDNSIIRKVLIKGEAKKDILSSLYTTGISFTHIYPELAYESKDIIMEHDIKEFLRTRND